MGNTKDDHDHHEDHALFAVPCNVKEIKIKVESSGPSDHHDHHNQTVDVEEDEEDGFRTPTGPEHRIPTELPCPPAPRKRRWSHEEEEKALKRRRCLSCRRRISNYRASDDHDQHRNHHDADDDGHDRDDHMGKPMWVIRRVLVSDEEVESAFTSMMMMNNQMDEIKRLDHQGGAGDIKKVNKANLTTL